MIPPIRVAFQDRSPITINKLAKLASIPVAVDSFSEKHHDAAVDPVPQPTKGHEALLCSFDERGRVLKWPMQAFRIAGKRRTLLSRFVANRYHDIELLPRELVHGFRPVARDIDPNLAHHSDGFRPHHRATAG